MCTRIKRKLTKEVTVLVHTDGTATADDFAFQKLLLNRDNYVNTRVVMRRGT